MIIRLFLIFALAIFSSPLWSITHSSANFYQYDVSAEDGFNQKYSYGESGNFSPYRDKWIRVQKEKTGNRSFFAFIDFGNATKGGDKLFRRGARDSSKLLKNQAQAAEKSKIGIHGVSVSSSSATSKVGQVVRCATCKDIESAGFKVHKTGRDPNHFTVELPKPVTKEVSKKFNDVFK